MNVVACYSLKICVRPLGTLLMFDIPVFNTMLFYLLLCVSIIYSVVSYTIVTLGFVVPSGLYFSGSIRGTSVCGSISGAISDAIDSFL